MLTKVQSRKEGKKLLFFLLLTMSIYVAQSQTNVYHPFPNNGAMWSVKWDGSSICQDLDYFSYGDSVINNLIYHKVWVSGVETVCFLGYPKDTISNYAGAYRNDSAAKKVYWLEADSIYEKLLYTFNIKVGDTLPLDIYNMYGGTLPVKVKMKDSVLLSDGTYRKAYWVGYAGQPGTFRRIVEGIGSEGGLIERLWDGISDLYILKCFTMDTLSLYPNNGSTCYPYIPSGFTPILNNIAFSIYPNPNNGTFILPKNFHFDEIKIYNAFGQEISFTISNKNEIDLSTLATGLFYLRCYSGKKVYVAKGMKGN